MATRPMTEAPLRSTLANDPDLAELVQMFVDEMPSRLQALQRSLAANDWEGLTRGAHQLKGAAGSYGFHDLTLYAAQLETTVRHEHAHHRAPALLEALLAASGRIRAGSGQD